MADRTFTPSEANSALERVRPLAERLVELAARAGTMTDVTAATAQLASTNGHKSSGGDGEESRAVMGDLERCLGELAEIGVEVKDIGTGLVDFPALYEDEEVLLCWRVGEPAVAWWHRREDGFAGRKPIDWGGA